MSHHVQPKYGRQSSSWIQKPGIIGAIGRFWQRSYAPDYLGFALLITAYMLIVFFIEPFHRMFSIDDLSKSYPHAAVERVPASWMFAYGGGLPLLTIVAWALILRPGLHQAHVSILGLFISLALTIFLTDVVKNSVGRPRPDLIARCKPKDDTPKHTLLTIEVCTETNHHVLQDGWRSFPSGHSSFAFAGLGYLALFLAGQMHVFRPRTDLSRFLVALAPLIGAALIAISRLEDYRHDVFDVTCGSLLGMLVAYFSYRRYYPSLRLARCNEPYPSRYDFAVREEQDKPKMDEEQGLNPGVRESLDDLVEAAETYPLNEMRVGP